MSRKSVAFNMTPIRKPDPSPADVWVKERTPDLAEAGQGATVEVLEAPAEPMKRFTIDVAEGLHKRIKSQCAMNGTKMADVIREMLEQAFPKSTA